MPPSNHNHCDKNHDNNCDCDEQCTKTKYNNNNVNQSPVIINFYNNCNSDNSCNGSKYKTCIAPGKNHKPKNSIEQHINNTLRYADIPSTLAGYIVKCIRRFLAGKKPNDSLEQVVFDILRQDSTDEFFDLLECGLGNIDKLSNLENDKLFGSSLSGLDSIDIDSLCNLFIEESQKRFKKYVGASTEEICQAGLPRAQEIDNYKFLTPYIFSINNLRTSQYIPKLNFWDYRLDEFDLACTANGCTPKICSGSNNCCNGDKISSPFGEDSYFCLAIPEVVPGDIVILKGLNFVDLNPKIKIPIVNPDTTTYMYLDAQVCGDVKTPTYIFDSRVNDVLTFVVPKNLPKGIYEFTVVLKNNTGIGAAELETQPLYFEVTLPPDTDYKITLSNLTCGDETDPEWAGSDEVGVIITAIPILLNGKPGNSIIKHIRDDRLDDVDSGDTFDFDEKILESNNILALSLSISGFEIDSGIAYEHMYNSIVEKFAASMRAIMDYCGEKLDFLPKGNYIGISIGFVLSLAYFPFTALLSFWSSPDLIMADNIFLRANDLVNLTTDYCPVNEIQKYTSNDISVEVRISDLLSTEASGIYGCVDQRDYWAEDSHYILHFNYERPL